MFLCCTSTFYIILTLLFTDCERKYTGAVFSHALIYGSHEDVSVILLEFSGRFKYIYLHLLKTLSPTAIAVITFYGRVFEGM